MRVSAEFWLSDHEIKPSAFRRGGLFVCILKDSDNYVVWLICCSTRRDRMGRSCEAADCDEKGDI